MKNIYLVSVLLLFLTRYCIAQTQSYGQIDSADLKMTSCSFEKDANAMVLFDKAQCAYHYDTIIMERHKRIKIFNDKGKNEANIRISYYGFRKAEDIVDLEAQTINLSGQIIEFTAVDKTQIFKEKVDKEEKAIVFTFPNVKSGSIIEFKYKFKTPYPYNYPDWFFQTSIPTKYSQLTADFLDDYKFNFFKRVHQHWAKDTSYVTSTKVPVSYRYICALADVPSYKIEPFMDYPEDYLQCIIFKKLHWDSSWEKVGNDMLEDEDFGSQLGKTLNNEEEIITQAKSLRTADEKISYIFNEVKAHMRWNKIDRWYTDDGIRKAWTKKTGNSTEINLVLYHLLKTAKVDPKLLAVSTHDNGKLNISYPTISAFNKTVVYCQIDSGKYYVLDATDKYNLYYVTPADLIALNTLLIDPDTKKSRLLILKPGNAKEFVLTIGKIAANGDVDASMQIVSTSYWREQYLRFYEELGEKKYVEQFEKQHKNLKVNAYDVLNAATDSLPLNQTFKFTYHLAEPDGKYLLVNPSLISAFQDNPFLNETRVANVDLGYLTLYSINARLKIPNDYSVDAVPKSISLLMPDTSISFKRIIATDGDEIVSHIAIDYKKTTFTVREYPALYQFYKKMYEMLNEQIVLKKL